MKIEWLNAERTEAIITRGWFWKKRAEVFMDKRDNNRWCFKATGRRVTDWTHATLVDQMEWVSVEKLPQARLLSP